MSDLYTKLGNNLLVRSGVHVEAMYLARSLCFWIFYFTWEDHSVYNTVLLWFPGGLWDVQTVMHYPDRNWLRGLCHPLHLPHKSDAVMERAAMETNFWALLEIETLRTRVKDLNHCVTLLLSSVELAKNQILNNISTQLADFKSTS